MAPEDRTSAEASLDEFKAAAEAMQAGMADLVASALRMQMLMLEDARNMMTEMAEFCAAAAQAKDSVREPTDPGSGERNSPQEDPR